MLGQAKREATPGQKVFGAIFILICGAIFIFSLLQDVDTTSTEDSGEPLAPGEQFGTRSFNLWVPERQHPEFSDQIGNEYFYETPEDAGTLFCMIPICVENKSNATETFIGVTWYLHTNSGLRFEIHSMADVYRDESETLNAYDIPPGITRCGTLVFLVTSSARESSTLILEADGFSFHARFEVPN